MHVEKPGWWQCEHERVAQAILRTDRLALVPLSDEHFELEVELDSDPEVMRFLTGQGRTREQVAAAHTMRLASAEAAPGLGFWVGFADGQFVGWWLLEPPDRVEHRLVPGEAELGYRLLRRYWRQGFASEGCRELLRHAFDDLDLNRVFALTMTVNAASRATMAAVGMRYVRTFFDDDGPPGIDQGGVEYEITRAEWATTETSAQARSAGARGC